MKVVKNMVSRLSKSKGIFGVIVGLTLGLGTGGLLLAQTQSQDWFSNGVGIVRAQQLQFESSEKNTQNSNSSSGLNPRYINVSNESQTKSGNLGIGIQGTPKRGFALSVGGPVNVNSNVISGVSTPVTADDAVNLGYLNQRLSQLNSQGNSGANLEGNFVTLGSTKQYKIGALGIGVDQDPAQGNTLSVGGTVNVNSNIITGLSAPQDGDDAVNLEYLENNYGSASGSNGSSSLAQTLNQGNASGGTDIQMTDGSTIKNVPPPSEGKEVATKEYVQQLISSAGKNSEGGNISGRLIEGSPGDPLSVLIEGGCERGFSVNYTGTIAGQSITEGFECVPGENLGQIEFTSGEDNDLALVGETIGVQSWLKEVENPREYCRSRGLFVPDLVPQDTNVNTNPETPPSRIPPQPASYEYFNSSNVKNAAILNEIESSSDLQLADGWKGVDRSETDNCGGDNQFVDGNDCVALVEKDISGPAVVACVSQSPGSIVDPASIVDGYSGP